MAEDVLQDDRAALKLRQPEERPEADRDDIRLGHGRGFHVLGEGHDRGPGPAAQEVEARIVGDAEQPAVEIVYFRPLAARMKRLDEGILENVLAADGRARHARAVAVKARPQRFQAILEVVHTRSLPPAFHYSCRMSRTGAPITESRLASSRILGK